MTGVFLSLRRVLPDRYPLDGDVERCVVWPGATVSAEERLAEGIRDSLRWAEVRDSRLP